MHVDHGIHKDKLRNGHEIGVRRSHEDKVRSKVRSSHESKVRTKIVGTMNSLVLMLSIQFHSLKLLPCQPNALMFLA